MLTGENFKAVAKIISKHIGEDTQANDSFDVGWDAAVFQITTALIAYFEEQSPKFDREQFLATCGLPTE